MEKPAPHRTLFHDHGNRSRDVIPKLGDPLRIQHLQVAPYRRDEHLVGHVGEEVARDLCAPRVRAVKRGHEQRGLARRVELEVRLTLREEHALVIGKRDVDLRDGPVDWRRPADDVAAAAIIELEDQSSDELALDDGEELVGARVRVRHVEPARVNEADAHGDVGADEGGEVVDGRERDGAARAAGDGIVDEGEGDIGGVRRVGEKDRLAVAVARGPGQGRLEGGGGVGVAVEAAGGGIGLAAGEGPGGGDGNEGDCVSQEEKFDHNGDWLLVKSVESGEEIRAGQTLVR